MRGLRRCRLGFLAQSLSFIFLILMANIAVAQGVPAVVGNLAPSSTVGMPGGLTRPAYLSSDMFRNFMPLPSNLDLGFDYSFGKRISTGQFWADYLSPLQNSGSGLWFVEGHCEYVGFWRTHDGGSSSSSTTVGPITQTFRPYTATATSTSSFFSNFRNGFPNRFDLSLGGGCRWLTGSASFAGVNAFFDTSRISQRWYPSWGCGLETAGILSGNAAYDLSANLYGNQFGRNTFTGVWRRAPGTGFNIEAGISLPVMDSIDLRLGFSGYGFNAGESVYGSRAGAEVTGRNGLFTFKYNYGHDRYAGDYHTVGGYINLAFQMENILAGQSPFSTPEPVFASPRNFRRVITRRVRRNWHQPTAAVVSGSSSTSTAATVDCRQLYATRTFHMNITWPGGPAVFHIGFNEGNLLFDPDLAVVEWEITITQNTSSFPAQIAIERLLNFVAPRLVPASTTGTFQASSTAFPGTGQFLGMRTTQVLGHPNAGEVIVGSGVVRFYKTARCP